MLNISDKYVLPTYSLFAKIGSIIDYRIESKNYRQDYLQILLEAYDESMNGVDKDAIMDMSKMKIEKKLTSQVKTKLFNLFLIKIRNFINFF